MSHAAQKGAVHATKICIQVRAISYRAPPYERGPIIIPTQESRNSPEATELMSSCARTGPNSAGSEPTPVSPVSPLKTCAICSLFGHPLDLSPPRLSGKPGTLCAPTTPLCLAPASSRVLWNKGNLMLGRGRGEHSDIFSLVGPVPLLDPGQGSY